MNIGWELCIIRCVHGVRCVAVDVKIIRSNYAIPRQNVRQWHHAINGSISLKFNFIVCGRLAEILLNYYDCAYSIIHEIPRTNIMLYTSTIFKSRQSLPVWSCFVAPQSGTNIFAYIDVNHHAFNLSNFFFSLTSLQPSANCYVTTEIGIYNLYCASYVHWTPTDLASHRIHLLDAWTKLWRNDGTQKKKWLVSQNKNGCGEM